MIGPMVAVAADRAPAAVASKATGRAHAVGRRWLLVLREEFRRGFVRKVDFFHPVDRGFAIEAQTGIHFGRDTAWNDFQNLTAISPSLTACGTRASNIWDEATLLSPLVFC